MSVFHISRVYVSWFRLHSRSINVVILVVCVWYFMCSISSPFSPTRHHMLGHSFKVIRLTQPRHGVYEHSGDVKFISSQLWGLVVVWEHMVVVVPTFAYCKKWHPLVLHWSNVAVIRLVPPEMSSRVDEPGAVQDDHIPEQGGKEAVVVTIVTHIGNQEWREEQRNWDHYRNV